LLWTVVSSSPGLCPEGAGMGFVVLSVGWLVGPFTSVKPFQDGAYSLIDGYGVRKLFC
jgi:hypothetical protein